MERARDQVVELAFSPLKYGSKVVTIVYVSGEDVVLDTFSPLKYGSKVVTKEACLWELKKYRLSVP